MWKKVGEQWHVAAFLIACINGTLSQLLGPAVPFQLLLEYAHARRWLRFAPEGRMDSRSARWRRCHP